MSDGQSTRVIVTGGAGFLGSPLCRKLRQKDCRQVIVPRSKEFDLTDARQVARMYETHRPDVVIHLAAVVGGIGANRAQPGRFFHDNLAMGMHLIEQARLYGVKKFVQVGTVCSYPRDTPVPFREEELWNGYPEETNAPYGIAKKSLFVMLDAYHRQYGMKSAAVLPVNLYGPGDNFDPSSSHVIPALIRKCVEAKQRNESSITCWGTGSATREFLHVEDAAEGVLRAAERMHEPTPINLGTGREITIRDLVERIAHYVGYEGRIEWDHSKPDGQPRRCLDVTRARELLDWEAEIEFDEGLKQTIDWYMRSTELEAGVTTSKSNQVALDTQRVPAAHLRNGERMAFNETEVPDDSSEQSKGGPVFVVGYPSHVGGADTELWHTLQMWKKASVDVRLIPTWHAQPEWRAKLDALGISTYQIPGPHALETVPDLRGSIVVSFCNGEFLNTAHIFKRLDCRIVWANCMTWVFPKEIEHYEQHGPFDAYLFQSEFQKSELLPKLAEYGVTDEQCHLVRGAFAFDEFPFNPLPHGKDEPFVFGRIARPDLDKWSSNLWPIYDSVQYRNKQARVMAWDNRLTGKCGPPPYWATALSSNAEPARKFLSSLHCMLPINGGAQENWPRSGLEAMAAGVPIVAQNKWGWKEMIIHGETGFLADDDCELAHYTAMLAYDEELRLHVATKAHERLKSELACPDTIIKNWLKLFGQVGKQSPLPV